MFALRVTHFSCVTTRNLFKRRHLPVCGGGRRKVTANAMSGSVDERADAVLKYWYDSLLVQQTHQIRPGHSILTAILTGGA